MIFNIYFFLFLFLLGLANQNLISFHLIPHQLFFMFNFSDIARVAWREKYFFFDSERQTSNSAKNGCKKVESEEWWMSFNGE